jgi:SSS family solute:Na+ symporter
MFKLAVQAGVGSGWITAPEFLVWLGNFNFLYYSGVLFLISIAIVVGVSLATAPPSAAQVAGLTYASLSASDKSDIRASADWKDYVGTAVVLGLVIGLYVYFSFWTS